MRVELQPWQMHVSIVEPGSIATPIWGKPAFDENMPAERTQHLQRDYGTAMEAFERAAAEAASRGISPDAVAAVVEHALTAATPRTRYLVGRDAKIGAMLRRLVPDRWIDGMLVRSLKLPRRG